MIGEVEGYKDAIGLFYDADKNVFVDEDGFVVWSIFELITPNDLFLFHAHKESIVVDHRSIKDMVVEIFYPDDEMLEP